jgi:sigma-B regulation protein RsbU (phosphoserine phosphatase)
VRHRLLVTWILVGVVPIVLICTLLVQGLYILMGQAVGYMTTSEIGRHSEMVQNTARALAWSLTHRGAGVAPVTLTETFVKETSETQHAELGAIVRAGKEVIIVPPDGAIHQIPEWSKPDFVGLIQDDKNYYFGAHVLSANPADKTEVFLYRHASTDFFKNLLPDVAIITPALAAARAGAVEIRRTEEKRRSGISFKTSRQNRDLDFQPPTPPSTGRWWDFAVEWIVLMRHTGLISGKADTSLAIVATRPSLVIRKLFSTIGNAASIVFVLMAITACVLLVVEIVSVLFGAKLTRSITRAVADLYEGTQKCRRATSRIAFRLGKRKTN